MNQKSFLKSLGFRLVAGAAMLGFSLGVQAHPYASGVTNDNGTVRFFMNEGGATVDVTFEDNSTLPMGVLPKGETNFVLGGHTSFKITASKVGNGTPALISDNTFSNSIWANPRGIAVNKNPKNGDRFGRIYAGSGGTGGFGWGTPGFKDHGIYAMNADQTTALGRGTNAYAVPTFAASGTFGPWKMRVAPDDSLIVTDFSTPSAAFWLFSSDLTSSNLLLAVIGQNAGVAAGIHGDPFGTPTITGSLAEGNLTLWTAEGRLTAPATATLGPGTAAGDANCVFRYDIGAGPIPTSGWSNPPNYAYTMGLQGIPGLRTEMDIAPDGKIICGFGRANLSNPNIQILSPSGDTLLYASGINPPANTSVPSDPWNGINGAGAQVGTYNGVRVSPDGRYLASLDLQSGVTLANLTNGIPDDGSIFRIQNPPASGTLLGGGLDWDVANNVYIASGNQSIIRIYSLGLTTTCVTSNDWTGTNGTFNLILPPVTASVAATTPLASQNYVNNTVNPGTPIPGVFRIQLNTNVLATPVTINFTRTGTAVYGPTNHYTINTNETPNGVTIGVDSVTFPAGAYAGANGPNWNVDVKIIPTANPVSTNTLTVVLQVQGGAANVAGAPARDTVFIQNTGPQLLLLTAAASGTTMYRGVTNDYARFVITRLGDTNGPGNSAVAVAAKPFTVTNVNYFGTAVYPTDYRARAQRLDPAGNGIIVPPTDGPTAIVINPGDTTVTCVVGNPVPHTDLSVPPVNTTIVVNLTNAVTGLANKSLEGDDYTVGTVTATLTLVDNTVGPEIVLWSNPLTNAADTSWTLAFAATNFGGTPQLPVVIPNYTNGAGSLLSGGTNDYEVTFGYSLATDNVEPSRAMAANGWNSALKMTVNKQNFAHAGVNVYPQGQKFEGNYALRFNMFISLYQFASNNPNIGSAAREFALFGVNHHGTNVNWRTAAPIVTNAGSSPLNSDGQWFAVGAGAGSITPADFDAFVPPAVPNGGVTADKVSASAASQNGVFKHPPFEAMNVTTPTVNNPGGGEPVNKWVDVSVEITRQTNINVFINRSQVLASFPLTNGSLATTYTNGTIMLGYNDPNADVSDNTAFAYFSNVRVVRLSPYILVQAGLTNSGAASVIVTQFSSLTLTSSATFASAPITNIWYRGTGTLSVNTGVPTVGLQTNSVNDTSMTDTFSRTFNNFVDGTNYMNVFSDASGSVTSRVVAVEVIFGPTNQTAVAGTTFQYQLRASGPVAPTAYQWRLHGTNLVNNSHYAGVTSTNLFITNVVPSDAGPYSVLVTSPAGTVTPVGILTVSGGAAAPPTISNLALTGGNAVMSFSTTNVADTTASFILQSSPVVEGPYTNTPGNFTGGAGAFQVTLPQGATNTFYRLLRAN
jgi:hypothetical protein